MKSIRWVFVLGFILAARGLPADSGQSGPATGQVDVGDAADASTDAEPASADLSYHPVSATAALSLRQSCLDSMRISQVKPDGKVLRGGLWLTRKEAGHYYRNADAPLAVRLNRDSVAYDIQGSVWMIASPVLGMVVGAYGGVLNAVYRYAPRNANGTYDTRDTYTNTRAYQESLVGGAIGLVLGAAIGLPMGMMDCRKAELDRQKAADTFNHKLMQDLQLYAVPKPGGGELGVQKQF